VCGAFVNVLGINFSIIPARLSATWISRHFPDTSPIYTGVINRSRVQATAMFFPERFPENSIAFILKNAK